ncbi:MAG TPA: ribose-5-phosphate isomerase RpiA [Blastocatellia bacterium]|nr:ribose-5-phosphate isomerase RpiA [Blastocatellia bacterium]
MSTQDEAKKRAAERAVEMVSDGQIIGLGTGSTSRFAIEALGRRVAGGLQIRGVATSEATAQMARGLGISVIGLNEVPAVDLTIDGADEVDGDFQMIKGGGGALTREKLVALASRRRVYIVDEKKLVERLGANWPVPVEVLPFAWPQVEAKIAALGGEPQLRMRGDRVFETDNENYILDCRFKGIPEPAQLEKSLKLISGVIESGLFIGIADVLIIGWPDRVEVREHP